MTSRVFVHCEFFVSIKPGGRAQRRNQDEQRRDHKWRGNDSNLKTATPADLSNGWA
jgi:hypothetical protein